MTEPTTGLERLFTRAEAAKALGLSTDVLDRLARTGAIRPTRLAPQIVRYRASELRRYLDACTSESEAR